MTAVGSNRFLIDRLLQLLSRHAVEQSLRGVIHCVHRQGQVEKVCAIFCIGNILERKNWQASLASGLNNADVGLQAVRQIIRRESTQPLVAIVALK